MSSDPLLRELANGEKRRQRVFGGRCEVCGTTRHLVAPPTGTVRCYEHLDGAEATIELDHLAGWRNMAGLLVALGANDHRDITEDRRALGLDALPPVDGEPLLAMAHAVVAIGTLLLLLGRWLVDFVQAQRRAEPPRRFPIVL